MPVVRVKSTHPESQGPFVLLDDYDFDPAKHELYDENAKPKQEAVKTPAEVLAMFEDPAVHFQTAKAEATKLLGDGAPTTKDELIAALTNLVG